VLARLVEGPEGDARFVVDLLFEADPGARAALQRVGRAAGVAEVAEHDAARGHEARVELQQQVLRIRRVEPHAVAREEARLRASDARGEVLTEEVCEARAAAPRELRAHEGQRGAGQTPRKIEGHLASDNRRTDNSGVLGPVVHRLAGRRAARA